MRRTLTSIIIAATCLVLLRLGGRQGRRREEDRDEGRLVRERAVAEHPLDSAESGPAGIDVVIAAYNEADCIGQVVDALPDCIEGVPVTTVVVSDGSTDETARVARDHGAVVVEHAVNRGQGDGLFTGIEIALRRKARVVVTMDADGQHRGDELHRLVVPVLRGDAAYVQGSRFLGEYDDRWTFRSVGIQILNRLVTWITGTTITDCTTGYRAIDGPALNEVIFEESRFPTAEFILEAAHRDMGLLEVPVHIQRRASGKSKKPFGILYPLSYLGAVYRVGRRQGRWSLRRATR